MNAVSATEHALHGFPAGGMPMLSNVLMYGAIPPLLLYFYLFRRTIHLLDASDQKRFVTDAGQPRWNLGLMALLGVLLFLAERRVTSIIVGGVLLVDLVVATVVHHSKLRRLGFPDAFRRRLAAISYLAGVLVLMVVAGVALKGR